VKEAEVVRALLSLLRGSAASNTMEEDCLLAAACSGLTRPLRRLLAEFKLKAH
tara:strand:+ start:543 stop:701 length:159 start_codon:yes stop_codon:yes gene_type:complete